MSRIELPNVNASSVAQTRWALRDDALVDWAPDIRAADSDERTITIYDVIGEDYWTGEGVTAKRISGALRKMGAGNVTVNINSPGGNFFDGVAIFNLLKEHDGEVTIRVMGLAASAASVIAMAGDKIEIAETGFMMIHNAWTIVIGNRHDIAGEMKTLEGFDTTMADLYAKRADVDVSAATEWMDEETWFNGKEAVEAGLATGFLPGDQVTSDPEASASTDDIRMDLRIDNMIRSTNPEMSRKERRALHADMTGGKRNAVPTDTPSAVAITEALNGLAQTINA